LDKIERKNGLIKSISNLIPDTRKNSKVEHSYYKILRQRVYLIMHSYEDVNDANYFKNEAIIKQTLEGKLASQPTISRFENSIDKHTIFNILYFLTIS